MRIMRTRLAAAALLGTALASTLHGQTTTTPEAQETFRASIDLVTIQTSVRDRRGRIVQGLTPGDFEVRDNGAIRPVLSLRADRRSPVSVAFLVDMSGSMRGARKIGMARQAFESVLAQLRDGEDEVSLFTFDSALHQRHDFTTELGPLKHGLDDFDPFGSTSLYDATAAAAARLAARSAAHKAVIVLTDGIDTSSTLNATQVSALASSIDVPVFVVATVPILDERLMMESVDRSERSDAVDLRDLAEWTGGRLTFASTFAETSIVAARLIDELRLQYVLAIQAADTREWRRLDVRVKNPSAIVKARSGYFGG